MQCEFKLRQKLAVNRIVLSRNRDVTGLDDPATYLGQQGDPQLNENARSRWRLLQCTMDSKYPEAAGAELIDYMTLRAAAVANSTQIGIRLNSRLKKRNPAEE
jgi:hypothetical protein